MQLQINAIEKQILEEILISEINELKEEIHHTDNYNYKEILKERLEILEKLLAKVRL